MFWEYHDYLYEQNIGLSSDQLKSHAAAIGLDTTAFNSCFDSGEHEDYVAADSVIARKAGARGTPTFMINGQLVASPSLATMIAAIRAAQ